MGCLLEILALFSPRLFIAVLGAGVIWLGGHFFGEVRRDDAPLRRALGPAGIPVEATVYSQLTTSGRDSKGNATLTNKTRLRYEHPPGEYRSEWVFLDDKAERGLPEGSRIACRLDPENPDFIVSARNGKPWTLTKLTLCVVLILFGAVIALAGLAAGSK